MKNPVEWTGAATGSGSITGEIEVSSVKSSSFSLFDFVGFDFDVWDWDGGFLPVGRS